LLFLNILKYVWLSYRLSSNGKGLMFRHQIYLHLSQTLQYSEFILTLPETEALSEPPGIY